MRAKLPLLIQLIFWIFIASPSQAATYTVNSTADLPLASAPCSGGAATCTLRAAIQKANATANLKDAQGKEIPDIIAVPAGAYTLTQTGANEDLAASGDLDITESVTITGAGSATTIIDGNAADRIFQIMSGATVAISDVTVQNGRVTDANGGGVYNSGTLSLSNCAISSNIVDTSISGGGGGGAYNQGSLTVTNCTIGSNQVLNNSGAEGGGGIQNEGATGLGSNIITTTIIGSTFSNNSAPTGAAVRNLFGRVFMDLTIVEANTADTSGGGISNGSSGSMSINRSAIRNNIAPQNGGGIDNVGNLDIISSTVYGNLSLGINPGAGGAGGGIFNSGDGAISLVNSTVSGNQSRIGGGLYNHREVFATNSTLFDNSATTAGSEVYTCGNPGAADTPPTGCDNGITDTTGKFIIHTKFNNSIVGNSTSTVKNCDGINPALTDSGGQRWLVSNGRNIEVTANTCGFTTSGDVTAASPAGLFSSGLVYNGGDVAALLTFAIQPTGPAHNNGDIGTCPIIDGRGFLRDEGDGLCDIGAYEISTTNTSFAVLDLALDIQYKNNNPIGETVQTTINFKVVNKGPLQASSVVLTGNIPALSWLTITSLTSNSAGGACSPAGKGVYTFTCTIPTIDAYKTADFNLAVLATAAGSYIVNADVTASGSDNYRPDNTKSITVEIPTVSGSGGGGFSGGFTGSGGGAVDSLALMALAVPALRRMRRRRAHRSKNHL